MDTFGNKKVKQTFTTADYLDQSAFDEKFEIELAKDYIQNIYHIEDKYLVPVLEGGYTEMYTYCKNHIIHPDDRGFDELMDPATLQERLDNAEDKGVIKAEFREKLIDNSYRWVQYLGISGTYNGVPEGKIYFYVFDIQNQKNRMEGITSYSNYDNARDPITSLRIRELFVSSVIERLNTVPGHWCCVAMDIQNFKVFNTWFGHAKGDYLLSHIGDYLNKLEEDEDAVAAYFGRDNFALVMKHDKNRIEQIHDDMKDIIHSYSGMIGFLPAFGVYVLEEDENPTLEIYDNARLAVSEAKKHHVNRISYYDSSDQERSTKEYEFLTEFQNAIINKEISFYIQPQCNILDGKIVGAEALVRWIKQDGTVVGPGAFVPFLESNDFITELDKQVWEQVCRWISSLKKRGIKPIPVSVNVSRLDLLAIDVPEYLYGLTRKYDIDPSILKVEVTESAYAEIYDVIDLSVQRLKQKGFSVYLDDFGAGYSSLSMLDKLNVDLLKLDMFFMNKDERLGKKGIGIVESVVGLTKIIDIPVIVEGVENEEQVDLLKTIGLRYAQGYYFYKPVSIDEFEHLLTDSEKIDHDGIINHNAQVFGAKEFFNETLFSESTLNKIIGAVAYYTLEDNNINITSYNESFRIATGDDQMNERMESIQRFIYPDDLPEIYTALQDAEEHLGEGGKCEIRFVKSDGSIFWYRMWFFFIHADENRKVFFGQVSNITEIVKQSLYFFDVLRRQSDSTMFIETERNRIRPIKRRSDLFAYNNEYFDLDEVVRDQAINNIDNNDDRIAFIEFFNAKRILASFNKAVYHETLSIDFRLEGQKSVPVEFSIYTLRQGINSSLVTMVYVKKRDRELLSLDPLTGMKNRYAYYETVDMISASGDMENLIVFSFDVNGLKSTNDNYGHLVGDEIIRAAGKAIDNVMSLYGSSYRIGGDEFVAFVYGDNDLAKFLQADVALQLSRWTGSTGEKVTVSSGFALASEYPDATISQLIKLADQMMYREKSQYYQEMGVDRRMMHAAYATLFNTFATVLKIDLADDSYELVCTLNEENKCVRNSDIVCNGDALYHDEQAATLSEWLKSYAEAVKILPECLVYYKQSTSLEYLRNYFKTNNEFSLGYRRMEGGDIKRSIMEIVATPDYSDDHQKLFLYVKDIGNVDPL